MSSQLLHTGISLTCLWSGGADRAGERRREAPEARRTGSPIPLIGSMFYAPMFSAVIVQRAKMSNLLDETKVDLAFVRSHAYAAEVAQGAEGRS